MLFGQASSMMINERTTVRMKYFNITEYAGSWAAIPVVPGSKTFLPTMNSVCWGGGGGKGEKRRLIKVL